MNNLITKLLKYALFLGATGQLLDAAIEMRSRAAVATMHGFISLRALNNGLVESAAEQRPRKIVVHGHSSP